MWSYAFNHEEAIRCFERAVEHDPGFALAHWGIAYAIGPNYNKPWEFFDPVDLAASLEKACDEVAAARACADGGAPVERALVEALGSRYPAGDAGSRPAATRRVERGLRRGDARRLPGASPTTSTSRRSSPTR